ncbi:hypothetical protein LTR22_009993 [Elasticomyces elasticus]|nr:hypothetical protein LTR22_009993 [Elasticomyces elasticus]KAK4921484.1 hypothetical protein LTR49_011138 [Elasticomyces elasticus]
MADTAKLSSIYQPLDASKQEIRVLYLLPSYDLDAPICVETKTVSMKDKPYYEALSYAWGNPNDTTEIWIRDAQTSGLNALAPMTRWSAVVSGVPPCSIEIPITTTLHGALRRLRLQDQTRIVWADAICINQTRIAEKNYQVSMMGDIYRAADNVNIWLGEDSNSQTKRWRDLCIREYGHDSQQDDNVRREIPQHWQAICIREYRTHRKSTGPKGQQSRTLSANTEVEAIAVHALYDLLSRPWFTRLWVIQEISLAKQGHFIVGSSVLPFPTVAMAVNRIERDFSRATPLLRVVREVPRMVAIQHESQELSEEMLGMKREYFQPIIKMYTDFGLEPPSYAKVALEAVSREVPPHESALMVLNECGNQQCKDEKDRVYALLSITTLMPHIRVDYAKTVEDVYIDAAAALLRNDELFSDVLYQACRDSRVANGIPSWVPDWRTVPTPTRWL